MVKSCLDISSFITIPRASGSFSDLWEKLASEYNKCATSEYVSCHRSLYLTFYALVVLNRVTFSQHDKHSRAPAHSLSALNTPLCLVLFPPQVWVSTTPPSLCHFVWLIPIFIHLQCARHYASCWVGKNENPALALKIHDVLAPWSKQGALGTFCDEGQEEVWESLPGGGNSWIKMWKISRNYPGEERTGRGHSRQRL